MQAVHSATPSHLRLLSGPLRAPLMNIEHFRTLILGAAWLSDFFHIWLVVVFSIGDLCASELLFYQQVVNLPHSGAARWMHCAGWSAHDTSALSKCAIDSSTFGFSCEKPLFIFQIFWLHWITAMGGNEERLLLEKGPKLLEWAKAKPSHNFVSFASCVGFMVDFAAPYKYLAS